MLAIKNCLVLSVVLVAHSLVGKGGYLSIYNNLIYPANVEVKFADLDKAISRTIASGKEERIEIPMRKGGSKYSYSTLIARDLATIKVTVVGQQGPVWKDGKVGSQVVGVKTILQEKSFVFTQGPGQVRQESATFVINADRNKSFINGIQQVDNLGIYRFIQ